MFGSHVASETRARAVYVTAISDDGPSRRILTNLRASIDSSFCEFITELS